MLTWDINKCSYNTKIIQSYCQCSLSARSSSPKNENVLNLRPSKMYLFLSETSFWSLFLHRNRFGYILHHITCSPMDPLQWMGAVRMRVQTVDKNASQIINWWTEVYYYGLLWCFYQLFGLSFWWHPFTSEKPLVNKWCNAKFLQICFYEETIYNLVRGSFCKCKFLGEVFNR